MKTQRRAGILLPVSSLPSRGGIGALGRAAYEFVDFLSAAGQSLWQVLPLSPTGFGDSPYQSFSAFAGNPYFIDPERLAADGLLTEEELSALPPDGEYVDYGAIWHTRFTMLRAAFSRFDRASRDFADFCRSRAAWLDDYALYMSLKGRFDNRPFSEWEDGDIARHKPSAVKEYTAKLSDEIAFRKFCQYRFFLDYSALHEYANAHGVRIVGDIPLYVAADSADFWAHRELFQCDNDGRPTAVAGVPPDYFSATGQLWGNPLYDWRGMASRGFKWWRARIAAASELYDVIRIDHFIGTTRYYAIPADSDSAINGEWREGPGSALVEAIDDARGKTEIIAEDLGVLHPEVTKVLKKSGYPGMKVLIFGADGGAENPHIPYKFDGNTVVYVGTHDNNTALGFCKSRPREELKFLLDYYNADSVEKLPDAMIRAAFSSVADTAVVAMQDWLGLDDAARMNVPSTVGDNWRWRLSAGETNSALAEMIRRMTEVYGRKGSEE